MTMQKLRWELKNRGFTMKKYQGIGRHKECSTEISTSNGMIEALAIYHNKKGEEYPIILDRTLIPEIGNNNIHLSSVKGGMPIPRVIINGVPEYLHRMQMQEELLIAAAIPQATINGVPDYLHSMLGLEEVVIGTAIDHKNHNRFCITSDNLRIATSSQNTANQRRSLPKIKGNEKNGFYFSVEIQNFHETSTINHLENLGYKMVVANLESGFYNIRSPRFTTVDKYIAGVRFFNKLMYGEFAYDPINDFEDNMDDFKGGNIGKGTELLIRHKIFKEFNNEAELLRRNIERLQGIMHNGIPLIDYM